MKVLSRQLKMYREILIFMLKMKECQKLQTGPQSKNGQKVVQVRPTMMLSEDQQYNKKLGSR